MDPVEQLILELREEIRRLRNENKALKESGLGIDEVSVWEGVFRVM